MIPVYAPEITALIDELVAVHKGEKGTEDSLKLLDVAWKRHRISNNRAISLKAVIHEDNHLFNACDKLLDLLLEREEIFKQLLEALSKNKVDMLPALGGYIEEVSFEITSIAHDIEEKTKEIPKDSPFQLIDECIKIGLAVYSGLFNHGILLIRIPELVDFHDSLLKTLREFQTSSFGQEDLFFQFH